MVSPVCPVAAMRPATSERSASAAGAAALEVVLGLAIVVEVVGVSAAGRVRVVKVGAVDRDSTLLQPPAPNRRSAAATRRIGRDTFAP